MNYGKSFKRIAKLEDCGISTSRNRDAVKIPMFDEKGNEVAEYIDNGKDEIDMGSAIKC